MKTAFRLFALLACLALPACKLFKHTVAQPTASPSQVGAVAKADAAVPPAVAKVDEATVHVDAEGAKRIAQVRADIDGARAANLTSPDGVPRRQVDMDLEVAQGRLSDVKPDPVEVAEVARRHEAHASGRAAEARASADKAIVDGHALSADLGAARAERQAAIEARDSAIAAQTAAQTVFNAQLVQNQKANQAAIDQLETQHRLDIEKAHNEVMRQQAMYLNIAGGALLLIAALVVGFGGLASFHVVWPLLLFAPLCFGLAQLVSQSWFMYACGGVLAGGMGVGGWWVWRHHRLGTLHAAAVEKADGLETLARSVVPVLDSAYEKASEETKALFDSSIFKPLEARMDSLGAKLGANTRNLVHTVRAAAAVADEAGAGP